MSRKKQGGRSGTSPGLKSNKGLYVKKDLKKPGDSILKGKGF